MTLRIDESFERIRVDGIRIVDYGREGKVESREEEGVPEIWGACESLTFYSWSC